MNKNSNQFESPSATTYSLEAFSSTTPATYNENLSAIKIKRRVRQPNWTEHEKELFCALTKKHQAILENKGNSSLLLKCKSDAWREIAFHMKEAGYYRPIDKLKQQLCRIRAAKVKKLKEALEKALPSSVIELENIKDEQPATFANLLHEENKENELPKIVTNDLEIKTEPLSPTECESSNTETGSGFLTISGVYWAGTDSGSVQQIDKSSMHQNLKPAVDTFNTAEEKDSDILHFATATDLVSPLSAVEKECALNSKTKSTDNVDCNVQCQVEQVETTPKRRLLSTYRAYHRLRFSTLRTQKRSEKRYRQIQKYRVAIQRQRLHAIKMEQERKILLHLKEAEIQDLKLQLLRALPQYSDRREL